MEDRTLHVIVLPLGGVTVKYPGKGLGGTLHEYTTALRDRHALADKLRELGLEGDAARIVRELDKTAFAIEVEDTPNLYRVFGFDAVGYRIGGNKQP